MARSPANSWSAAGTKRSTVEIIAAKRDGGSLSDADIRQVIAGYTCGDVPDYQMAALAMAIVLRGMDARETGTWTEAMLGSGERFDLTSLGSRRALAVDKHSTGGVGDKISLPLAPAAAACGVIVPMIAGRGLGHTGGTIDKLETIPGYRADLSAREVVAQLAQLGCVITGQTVAIAPADRKLYALRDVTGTVESIPLITASIMGKKLAEDIRGLVLDVKVGKGAFMKTLGDARALAQGMIAVGERMGTRVIAYLTRMEEPLGRAVGNANEVRESLEVLAGRGPADVRELTVALGGAMVELAHGVDPEAGRLQVAAALDDGRALERFEAMVAAQGGRLAELPSARGATLVEAQRPGFVTGIDGHEIGLAGVALGAGRARTGDAIDPVAGIEIERLRGAAVAAGEPLATVLHDPARPPSAALLDRIRAAFEVGPVSPERAPLLIERIG